MEGSKKKSLCANMTEARTEGRVFCGEEETRDLTNVCR